MEVEIKSIMCPTDFSDFSNYAAYQGIFIAKNLGAKLYVCHVVDFSSVTMYPEGLFSSSDRLSEFKKYAYEYFERRFGFLARLYASLGFILNHFAKMGTVFFLISLALSGMTGMSTVSIILIIGALVILITLKKRSLE